MTQRTSRTSVTFTHSFFLAGLEVLQPAGTYRIETVDVELDNLSFLAYRRVSTTIELPAIGAPSLQRQLVAIDPLELEGALKRDKTAGEHAAVPIPKEDA
jgi:hypothetical protein